MDIPSAGEYQDNYTRRLADMSVIKQVVNFERKSGCKHSESYESYERKTWILRQIVSTQKATKEKLDITTGCKYSESYERKNGYYNHC